MDSEHYAEMEADLPLEEPLTERELTEMFEGYCQERGLCAACGIIDRVPGSALCEFCWSALQRRAA